MRINVASGVLLVLVALARATSLHATETPDCTLKKYASLDLAGDLSRSLVVPVTIQDSQVYMILNTSSGLSSITESAARRLSLQTHLLPSSMEVLSGGKPIQKTAMTKSFALGNVQFNRADFVVIPDDSVGSKISGILGMNIFAHLDIEIDVANRKLNLYSPDHCPGHVVYWSKSYDSVPIRLGDLGEFYSPMELEGKKMETSLATGNAVTTLSTEVTKKLYGFDASSSDIESETDAAGKTTSHYRAMKLSAEGLNVINANITLVGPAGGSCRLASRSGVAGYEGCLGRHPLLLGLSVLTKLHVYIATKERVLYFTPAVVADQS
jgi:predicted aspartyl protease